MMPGTEPTHVPVMLDDCRVDLPVTRVSDIMLLLIVTPAQSRPFTAHDSRHIMDTPGKLAGRS